MPEGPEIRRAADQVFVMGDPKPISWHRIFTSLAQALGVRPPRLNLPELVAYPLATGMEGAYHALRISRPPLLTRYRVTLAARDCHFVSDKAERLLGYRPQVGFDEALERTVAWYQADQQQGPEDP